MPGDTVQHVWVTHHRDEPRAALLLSWRRVPDGRGQPRWEGWVVYTLEPSEESGGGLPSIHHDWVYAESIHPADKKPHGPAPR